MGRILRIRPEPHARFGCEVPQGLLITYKWRGYYRSRMRHRLQHTLACELCEFRTGNRYLPRYACTGAPKCFLSKCTILTARHYSSVAAGKSKRRLRPGNARVGTYRTT